MGVCHGYCRGRPLRAACFCASIAGWSTTPSLRLRFVSWSVVILPQGRAYSRTRPTPALAAPPSPMAAAPAGRRADPRLWQGAAARTAPAVPPQPAAAMTPAAAHWAWRQGPWREEGCEREWAGLPSQQCGGAEPSPPLTPPPAGVSHRSVTKRQRHPKRCRRRFECELRRQQVVPPERTHAAAPPERLRARGCAAPGRTEARRSPQWRLTAPKNQTAPPEATGARGARAGCALRHATAGCGPGAAPAPQARLTRLALAGPPTGPTGASARPHPPGRQRQRRSALRSAGRRRPPAPRSTAPAPPAPPPAPRPCSRARARQLQPASSSLQGHRPVAAAGGDSWGEASSVPLQSSRGVCLVHIRTRRTWRCRPGRTPRGRVVERRRLQPLRREVHAHLSRFPLHVL